MKTIQQRFDEKTFYVGDCIVWIGGVNNRGYPQFLLNGKSELAHRVAYKARYGELKDDQQLDHICRTPRCVNPGHLEPVSQSENMRRAYRDNPRPKMIFCRKGHKFTPESTIHHHGMRECRICFNEGQRRRRELKKATCSRLRRWFI